MRPSVKLTVPLGGICTRVTSLVCDFSSGAPLSIENRKIQTLITHEIMEISTYFFWQIFIIFYALSPELNK